GAKAPDAFKQACTRFIDVAALARSGGATTQPTAAAPAPAVPTEPKGRTEPIDAELIKLLIDAYNAGKRDERGFVSLSDLGRRAGNRSSFDARNYGFARLSDLIEAVPNFQAERRSDGEMFVKRVR
ncbi:MAG: OST-HTH/LOTUS domain-containing protein, partial [Sphingomonas sp.]